MIALFFATYIRKPSGNRALSRHRVNEAIINENPLPRMMGESLKTSETPTEVISVLDARKNAPQKTCGNAREKGSVSRHDSCAQHEHQEQHKPAPDAVRR
ncbi:hypothetical protein AYI69_g5824 [Smittium culicis]|uniref:Uncharacterized protein n=1 Tax=Smittium culicis TaxID=133412 RepID=A0A1R1Y3T1_9FUNG|nr:hypothetical protein AYI69_g5824 [Smittium culicis]